MRRNAGFAGKLGLWPRLWNYDNRTDETDGPRTPFKNAIAGFGNPVYWRDGACRRLPAASAGVPLKFLRPPATMVRNFDDGTPVRGPNQVYARLRRKFISQDDEPSWQ